MAKRGEIFKSISVGRKLRTNVFDLSHEKKLTANMADLVPIYLQECVPGDKFKGQTELMIRLAPMVFPVMHRINAYIHYFFVPNRLIWDNWKDFITGGVDGKNNAQVPFYNILEGNKHKFAVGTLPDYMGIPAIDQTLTISGSMAICSLPFRAYQLIYNEYYRDQTLTPAVPIAKTDGSEPDATILDLRKRSWEKDYFTSALNDTQRGDDISIPTEVTYLDGSYVNKTDGTPAPDGALTSTSGGANVSGTPVNIENIDAMIATVNDLRTSIVLQQWLEKNARAGARYVESILAHFQRRIPDYRLQRPEMIGGGKQTILISEVLSNFENTETALGKMAGHGISVGSQSGFKYTADEHGYIIGILSVMPRTGYYQGINKGFFKKNRFDWYWPEFSHLGEQSILEKELFIKWDDLTKVDDVFGYQSRYSEYKYIPDSVHGEFRTSLESFHLARKFTDYPLLNASFVEANPDDRIFAVQDLTTQKLWVQLYNNIRAIRPMPVYGTPIL